MKIKGFVIDDKTRCKHYHSVLDIVAIKFKCCDEFYPCYKCHNESTKHSPSRWNKSEFNEKAILCGNCKNLLTITQYINTKTCPFCKAGFNPNCKLHYDLYFEI